MQPMNPSPGPDDPYGDPALDGFEAPFGQTSPTEPYEVDPLHGMLDAVEGSIEQGPLPIGENLVDESHDPSSHILDGLENDAEDQLFQSLMHDSQPPEVQSLGLPVPPVPEVFGSFQSESPLPDGGEHLMKEYPLPPRLSRAGQGTGSKFLGGGIPLGWCGLRGMVVSSVDCQDCQENCGESCEYWSGA